MTVYKALEWTPEGKVCVKLSTGEPPASNYLRPELIKDLVQQVMVRLWNAILLMAVPGKSRTSPWGGDQDDFLESMGDAAKAVSDYLESGKRIVYINVMNCLSVDCDCNGNPAEPDMHDIGILASTDPVALDQTCVDLVYAAKDGKSLINRIESRNGLLTLEHAEKIGLGSRKYRLISIDN